MPTANFWLVLADRHGYQAMGVIMELATELDISRLRMVGINTMILTDAQGW
jgi:hypothetical protein